MIFEREPGTPLVRQQRQCRANCSVSQLGDHRQGGTRNWCGIMNRNFPEATPAGRLVILRASDDLRRIARPSRSLTSGWPTNGFEASREGLKALQAILKDPERKAPWDRPAKQPQDLDMCWANFLITGDYAAGLTNSGRSGSARIARQKPSHESASPDGHSIPTLEQHPKLVELVRKNLKDRPERRAEKEVRGIAKEAPLNKRRSLESESNPT